MEETQVLPKEETPEFKILQDHIRFNPSCVIIASADSKGVIKVDISPKGSVSDLILMQTILKMKIDRITVETFNLHSEDIK